MNKELVEPFWRRALKAAPLLLVNMLALAILSRVFPTEESLFQRLSGLLDGLIFARLFIWPAAAPKQG